jgi:hypothetical protein
MKYSSIILSLLLVGFCSSASAIESEYANSGVVKRVQCNKDSGLGIVEIQRNIDSALLSQWYKVKSKELCSIVKDSPLFPMGAAKLVSLGASNITNVKQEISQLFFDGDGYLVDVARIGNVDSFRFLSGVSSYKRVDVESAHAWYFSLKS